MAGNLRRIRAHHPHKPAHIQVTALHKGRVRQGKCRLRTNDSKGRLRKPAALLLRRVGCVVRGNAVEHSVADGFPKRFHILSASKRRVHLVIRIVRGNLIVAHCEMVRTNLSGNRIPLFLRCCKQFRGKCSGNMAKMHMASGLSRQNQISCGNHILHGVGNPRKAELFGSDAGVDYSPGHKVFILAVGKHRKSDFCSLPQCLAVYRNVHDGPAVLGHRNRASLLRTLQIGDGDSLLPKCNRRNGKKLDAALVLCSPQKLCNFLRAVRCRGCIGHRRYCCVSAGCSGFRAGCKGLFCGLPGVP